MPLSLPEDTTDWWCDPETEFAFLGFSYEVTACEFSPSMLYGACANVVTCSPLMLCSARPYHDSDNTRNTGQSPAQLHKEFADIRNHFQSRYVRLYGFCDKEGF